MAAADAAEGKGFVPEELRLAFRCQQWGSLPMSGGLLDQPAGLVEKMTVAINVFNAWKYHVSRDPKSDAEYFKSDTWKVAKEVIDLRKNG